MNKPEFLAKPATHIDLPTWAVTFKAHKTDKTRIVCVKAASISRAVALALEATRPTDRALSAPSTELVRCVNFSSDAVAFSGIRVFNEASVTMTINSDIIALPLRLELACHSPTGFEWGYNGSGPAQLALAIATQLFGDDLAVDCYQRLKERVFAGMQRDAWTLSGTAVRRALAGVIPSDD
jgi:uncharacterized protein (DUF2249 family)